jgi:Phage integrase family
VNAGTAQSCSAPRGSVSIDAATRIVKRLARAAGITKRISPHSLRHCFITAALDAGVPLRDVQDAASHADPRTTSATTEPATASTATPPTSCPPSSPAQPVAASASDPPGAPIPGGSLSASADESGQYWTPRRAKPPHTAQREDHSVVNQARDPTARPAVVAHRSCPLPRSPQLAVVSIAGAAARSGTPFGECFSRPDRRIWGPSCSPTMWAPSGLRVPRRTIAGHGYGALGARGSGKRTGGFGVTARAAGRLGPAAVSRGLRHPGAHVLHDLLERLAERLTALTSFASSSRSCGPRNGSDEGEVFA